MWHRKRKNENKASDEQTLGAADDSLINNSNEIKPKKIKKHLRPWTIALPIAIVVGTASIAVYAANSYTYSTASTHAGVDNAAQTVSGTWTQKSDNTWTMDTNEDGKPDINLVSSKDDDGDDVWTYTFNVADDTTPYYVYEEMTNNDLNPLKSGYTASGQDNKEAIPQEPGTVDPNTHTYTITNHKDNTSKSNGTGSLKITKNVTGDMKNSKQKFKFTITLTSNDNNLKDAIKGAQIYGDVPFMNGVGTVSLGKDESAEMTDIPAGLTYTITEENVDGYENVSKTHDTGTIVKDDDKATWSDSEVSVWENKSTYVPPLDRSTAKLLLTKKISGYEKLSEGKTYDFDIHFSNLVPYQEYVVRSDSNITSGTDNDKQVSFTAADDGDGDAHVTLQKDQTAEIDYLPVEATYQIKEGAGNYTTAYTVTNSGSSTDKNNPTWEEDVDSGNTTNEQTELATKNLTIPAATSDGKQTNEVDVTFTNHYATVQSLTLRKFIVSKDSKYGPADADTGLTASTDPSSPVYNRGLFKAFQDAKKPTTFEVTVDFKNLPQGFNSTSSIGKIIADEYGECSKTFEISGDGTPIVFNNLPAGATYQITETHPSSNDYLGSYTTTTVDSEGKQIAGTYTNTGAKEADDEYTDLSTDVETIDENQSDTVTISNEYLGPVIIPTGIFENNRPLIIIAAVAIVGCVGLVVFKKRKKQ